MLKIDINETVYSASFISSISISSLATMKSNSQLPICLGDVFVGLLTKANYSRLFIKFVDHWC